MLRNLKDNLFPKLGSSYSERRKISSSNSKIVRELSSRSTTIKNKHGQEKPILGNSSPINPTNLRNFDRARISIDIMKDCKKTDYYNNYQYQ